MATLYFKIGADYENVIRLRDEIKKLENQLRSFGKSTPETQIRQTEERLANTRQEFVRLTTEAAKAGAVMESDLKRKINSVTKASDELSEEIIKQRKIIRDTQDDVRRLSEQYSKMGKYSPQSTSTLNQLNKAKSALNEQKYALGDLQDQQARNRLELRQLTREYRDFSQGTDKATVTVDALMSSLKRTAAEIGGLAAIKKFSSDVINATGTMQQLHVALSTILQDGDKASTLISEITQFAAKTQFNLEDVASGAKQLLAYGSSAETVVDELSMLGDVAAGLQIPIGQLIYLYGTLRTQGRAMTVDIRQFAGRGIPIYEELAKVLGVAKDQVGDLVTAGKVGFKEVEQAFKNMTSEGGKFNNMLENSAGTWPQRISNIEDVLFQKLNDFGNKYKEVFEFGIGTAEELVEHLDDVISVIGGLVAAYGTYKAALIATAVAQKAVGFVESIRLIMSYRKQLGLATAAQQAFNLAAKSNVYVALLSVLVGLGTAVYMFTKRTNEATAAQEALSKVNKKADEEFSSQAATIDLLNGVLKSETASLDQKKKALSELQNIIPDYNASLNEEGKLINNNTEAIKAYLVQLEKQIKLKAAQEELEELYRSKRLQEKNVQTQQANYDRTRKQNPIGVVYGGDAGIEAQRLSLNRIAKAEKSLKDANDELKDTQTQIALIEKEIEQTSLTSSKAQKPISSLSNEIKNASEKIRKLKKEISDLRSGKMQAEAGKTVKSTIEAKVKELKSAQETLETLTGKDSKTEKSARKATRDANVVTAAQGKVDGLTGKQARERAEREAEIEAEVAQARIDALADGAEKARRQRELDNKKELDAIERQKQAYIEKETQAQREIFEAEEDLKAKRDPKYRKRAFDASSVSVDTSAFDELSALTQKRQAGDAIKAQEAAWREYLLKYGDYQQRRQAIAEKYSEAIDASGTAGEAAMLQKEMQEELDALDEEMRGSATLMGQLFADASEKSVGEIQKIIDKAEQLMAYLGAEKDAEGTATIDGEKVTRGDILALGISENTLENLERSPEEVEALRKGIARLKGEVGSRSPFKQLEENIKAGSTAIRQGKAAEGIKKIGDAVAAFAPALSEAGQSLGTIFGSDELGTKIAGVADALGGLGDTAAGVGQMMSGDIVGGAMAAVNGIASVVSALDGLFGADYSEYYALKEQYDQLSEIWDELIAKKKEYIGIDYGAEAQKAGAEALELLREQDEYARRLAQSAADAGSSIGSHSIAYRQNRDLGGYLGELRTYMGADNQGEALTQTLIAASAEELREVREGMYQMWMGLDGDFRSALEERIAVLEEQEEVLESMKDAITGTTFDTFYDSYVDMLADMDTDNQDLADNFEDYLRKSILSSLVADKYKEKIRGLYDTWTELGKDGISKGDAELLQQMQQELSESMLADRESLAETFGWNGGSSQSGSQGTFQTMSQEQADELSGRFTAVYEGELRIEQGVVAQTQAITEIRGTIADLSVQSARMYNIADETRSILANSYLELREINENTGAIIKPIKQIQADMAAVKQNTSRI